MEKITIHREEKGFGLFDSIMEEFCKYRLKLYIFVIVSFFMSLLIILLIPNNYTATARIMSDNGSQTNQLASIASSIVPLKFLSSAIMSGSGTEGAKLKGLFISNEVLDAVLEHQYINLKNFPDGNLYQLFDIENKQYARDELLVYVSLNENAKTGIMSISALTNDPVLSSQIANECVSQLDKFKRKLNVAAACENKRFYSEQLEQFKANLTKVEEEQAAFLLKNRNYFSSTDPVLCQKVAEFKEEAFFNTKVVMGIKQLLVAAETEINRDIPSLKIIETAEIPLLKSGPPRSKYLIISLFSSFFFGFGLIVLKNAYRWYFPKKSREELSSSMNIICSDINRVVNWLRTNNKEKVIK